METLTLDAEAGQVSAELTRRGTAADVRVHLQVEVVEQPDATLSMAAAAQAGGAFDWLSEEPDLYSDEDWARPGARQEYATGLVEPKEGDKPALKRATRRAN